MTTMHDDAASAFLQQAVRLALSNVDQGRAPFGAVVVRNGEIIGTGVNTAAQDRDPTAHAEVAAIRDACRRLDTMDLTGAAVVSSCEPCALCQVTCAITRVGEIIYAAPREFVPGADKVAPILRTMQDEVRRILGERIRYVSTPGADEPFKRYVDMLDTRP